MNTRPKIIILGDESVGKTSISNRIENKPFRTAYKATIGADFINKEVTIDDKSVTFQFWDTAGQERFRSLGNAFYSNAAAALIVFDITKQTSFDHLPDWVQEIKTMSPEAQIIVVANKCDAEKRVVSAQTARSYADEIKASYYEVSAKEDLGIAKMLEDIAQVQIKKLVAEAEMSIISDNKHVEFTLQSVEGISVDYFKQRYLAQYRSECFFKNPWSKMLVDIENDILNEMRMQNVIDHANRNTNYRTAIVLRELIQEKYDEKHGLELPRK